MPICVKCDTMDATVNLRRRRPPHTGEFMCKDDLRCKRRIAAKKAEVREARESAKRVEREAAKEARKVERAVEREAAKTRFPC